MFDLQPGVGLEEVELVPGAGRRVEQKLEGAERGVADVPRDADGRLEDGFTGLCRQVRGRGDFHDLLEPALDRAFAFPEVTDAAMQIADDLNLDVPGARNQLLHVKRAGAERHLGFRDAAFPGGFEFVDVCDRPRAATATAGDRLEHDRRVLAQGLEELHRLGQADCFVRALNDRNASLARRLARAHLVAEQVEQVWGRTNERDPGVAAGAGELSRFGEESVAGVDGVAAGVVGGLDQTIDVEVRRDAQPVERDGFVGGVDVQRLRVVLGVNRHGRDAQVGRCPRDTDGNLATIGDQ